ncbi:hypothetical protein GCM10028820_03270 [Tessaracoccus terricola]
MTRARDPGLLYRHFPTRSDLVVAVYRQQVEDCAEAGPELLASEPAVPGGGGMGARLRRLPRHQARPQPAGPDPYYDAHRMVDLLLGGLRSVLPRADAVR